MSNSSRKKLVALAFMLLGLIMATTATTVYDQEDTVEKHCDEIRQGPITKKAIVRSCSG